MKKLVTAILALFLLLPAPLSALPKKQLFRRILMFGEIKAETNSQLRKDTSVSQEKAINLLEKLRWSGDVGEFTPFWIQNAISVNATLPAIETITNETGSYAIEDVTIHAETRYSAKADPEWNLKMIGATDVWQTGNKGKGVSIGVLDSGCDITHPELKGKVSTFAYFDEYGRKGLQTVPFDGDGHGTAVSSIIAGETIGVAPECNLIVGCVLPGGSGNLSQIMAGIQWIADPDDDPQTKDYPLAVNMSFGMPSVEEYLKPGISNLINLGILPIASIGNDGEGTTSNPGNLPEVVAVGSVNSGMKSSSFSSGDVVVWETFDDYMTVTKPDLCAPGEGIRVASLRKTYDIADGTSFAAPHVAGMCALLGSQNPGINLVDLKSSIIDTTTDLGRKGRDSRFGEGLANVRSAIAQTQSRKSRNIKISRPGTKPIYGQVTIKTSDRTYEISPEMAKDFTFLSSDDSEIEINAFGFKTVRTSEPEIELEPLPVHKVTLSTISPLLGGFTESTVLIKDSPIAALDAPDGTVVLGLPEGRHTFLITSFGHTVARVEKEIAADTEFTVTLEPATLGFIDGRRSFFGMKPVPIRGKLKPALDATGLPWFYWSLSSGKVTANQLARFPYLVWNAGGTLDTKEISILSQYLDGGGKLVLTSSFFGASYFGETPTTPFLASYFHCTGLEDGGMTIKWSKQGSFRSLALTTQWGFASSSRLIPADEDAKPFLSYAGNEAMSYAGLRISTPKTQGIILGFTFPDISSIEDAKWLMKLCVDSFDDTVCWNAEVSDPNGKPLSGSAKLLGATIPFSDGQLVVPHVPAQGTQIVISSFGNQSQSVQISTGNLPKTITLQPAKTGLLEFQLNTDSWLLFEDVPVSPKKISTRHTLELPEGSYLVTVAARNFRPKTLSVKVPGQVTIQLEKKDPRVLTINPHVRLVQALGSARVPYESEEEITAGEIIGSLAFIWSDRNLPNAKTAKLIDDVKTAILCDANVIIMGQGPSTGYGDPVGIDAASTPVFSISGQGILDGMLISTSLGDTGYQFLGVPVIAGGESIAEFIGTGCAMARYGNLVVSAVSFDMIDLEVVAAETLRRILRSMNVNVGLPQGKFLSGTAPSKKPDVTVTGVAVPGSSAWIRVDGQEQPLDLDPEGFFTFQTRLTEGTHKLEIVSKRDGLMSVSQPSNLVVDMTPPVLKVFCPRGGKVSSSEIELIASVSGASEVSIDGNAFKPDSRLARKRISTGSGSIYVQASDEAGNRIERNLTYNFDENFASDSRKSPFWQEINQISASGIYTGSNQFEPDRPLTKLECAVWTARMLELSPVSVQHYTDLPKDSPETGLVNALVKAGILSGKGKFDGASQAKREFIVTVLSNAVNTKKQPVQLKFSDILVTNPYYKPIAKAVACGIVVENDKRLFVGGKFGMGLNLSRSKASSLYYNALLALAKGE